MGYGVVLNLFDVQLGEQYKIVTLRVMVQNGQYVEDSVGVHFFPIS